MAQTILERNQSALEQTGNTGRNGNRRPLGNRLSAPRALAGQLDGQSSAVKLRTGARPSTAASLKMTTPLLDRSKSSAPQKRAPQDSRVRARLVRWRATNIRHRPASGRALPTALRLVLFCSLLGFSLSSYAHIG